MTNTMKSAKGTKNRSEVGVKVFSYGNIGNAHVGSNVCPHRPGRMGRVSMVKAINEQNSE